VQNHRRSLGVFLFFGSWEAKDLADIQRYKAEGYELDMEEPRGFDRGDREDLDTDPVTQTFEWQYYFQDLCDVDNPLLWKPSRPPSDAVLPLKSHGPGLDDFLFANMNHPSKYALLEEHPTNPDGQREPRPTLPRNRTLPDADFVNKYKGYLFLSGLVPHLESPGGEVKDFDDARHKQDIMEAAAKLFEGVNSTDVWPATPTSAFVGFDTKLKAKAAMISSAEGDRLQVSHPVILHKYENKGTEGMTPKKEQTFAENSPSSLVKVTGLPADVTTAELLKSMFVPGSKLEAMFDCLTPDDCCRLSPTSLLIRFASDEKAALALKSANIRNNTALVGKRSVQVRRAKRERVFAGWVSRLRAGSKLSTRLLVTGDVPPQEMYLSHHDTLHIAGLPPHVTLDDLALFFQPVSADRRDVYGSGHIVRCSRGLPTGEAYVGFELPGELAQVQELYGKGKANIGGAEVTFRSVRDKLLRRGVRSGARPARSVEELGSDLRDWERHVDPQDIQDLADLGIEKGVLDEIMLTLRHHNRTFAAGDQAISGERLYQERATGTHYRDVVRKYVKVLKSCAATKEDPGDLFRAMHHRDEELDTGLFEEEEERIKKLRAKTAV